MMIEQKRADFEAWARGHLGMRDHIDLNWEAEWTKAALKGYQAGRAALQSPEVQAWKRDAERYIDLVSAWLDDDDSADFIFMNKFPPDAYESKFDIDDAMDAAKERQT